MLSLLLSSICFFTAQAQEERETGFILLSPGKDGTVGTDDDVYITEQGDIKKENPGGELVSLLSANFVTSSKGNSNRSDPVSEAASGFSNLEKFNTVYYVSPSGNDTTGDGTESNPFQTWDRAYAEAGNGDAIYLKAGTYTFNWDNGYLMGYSRCLWYIGKDIGIIGETIIRLSCWMPSKEGLTNGTECTEYPAQILKCTT